MRAHHAERGDVPVLHAVGRVLLHLGEHVANDLGRIVGCFLRSRDLSGKRSSFQGGWLCSFVGHVECLTIGGLGYPSLSKVSGGRVFGEALRAVDVVIAMGS
nr:hypothetical protein CFP56_52432 [Quercus suber]